MDLFECISTKRSIRTYTDEVIPPEKMNELLRLGTMASTGSNMQPWGFVVIQDKEKIDRLSQEVKAQLLANLEEFPHLAQYEKGLKTPGFSVFNHASNLLVIYGSTASRFHAYDCTLAAGNIMLAAHGMGIGTCWIGFAEYLLNTPAFKAAYGVPDEYELVCPMTLGFHTTTPEPPSRKPPLVFYPNK